MDKITKFENIKFDIFQSKEEYLTFRQAWKDYINSGKAQPSYYTDPQGGQCKKSNLDAIQHLLFCILTQRDLSKSFRPSLTKEGKKYNFEFTYFMIQYYARRAREVVDYENVDSIKSKFMSVEKYEDSINRKRESLEKMLEPFGQLFTLEKFVEVHDKYLDKTKLTNRVDEIKEAA